MFFWGTGSFTMGDWLGGLLVGSLQIASEVFFISGMATVITAWATTPDGYSDYDYDGPSYDKDGEERGITMLIIGGVTSIIHIVASHASPHVYDKALAKKNGTYFALDANPFRNIMVTMLPDGTGAAAMNVTYSFSY
jgi:hypothetical protein